MPKPDKSNSRIPLSHTPEHRAQARAAMVAFAEQHKDTPRIGTHVPLVSEHVSAEALAEIRRKLAAGEKLTEKESRIVEARAKRKAERDAAWAAAHPGESRSIPHVPVLTAEERAALLAKPREELTQVERIALARAPREGVQAAPLKPEDMRRRGAIKAAERALVAASVRGDTKARDAALEALKKLKAG